MLDQLPAIGEEVPTTFAPPAAPPRAPAPAPLPAIGKEVPQGGAAPAMNFAIVNGRRVPIDDATDEPKAPASLWDQANTSPLHHYFEAARKAVDDAITHAPGLDLAEAKANDLTGPLQLGTVSAMGRGAIAGGLEGALNYGESYTTPVGAVLALTGLGAESAIVKQIPALKPLINLPAVQALKTAIHTTAGAAFAAHGAGTIYDAATDPAASTSEKLQRAAQGTFELAGGALGVAPAVEQGAAYWAQQRRTAAGARQIVDFKKAAPPSVAAPYSDADLHASLPRLIDEHHTTAPITNIGENLAAADRIIAADEQGISDQIAKNPTELIPTRPIDEVRARMSGSARADDVTKGVAILKTLNLDQPTTVEAANKARRKLNAENDAALSKNKYDRALARESDPQFAAREIAAGVLRDGIAQVLDARAGVGGFTSAARADQGSMIAIRNALKRQEFRNEARVGGTGATSVGRRIAAGAVKAAGAGGGALLGETFAGGHVGGALGAIAGHQLADPIAAAIDRPPLTRDQLIERVYGASTPSTALQSTPGTPPPPVAPGAGPGGPGAAPGGPGAPAAGPGLPPPGPVTPPPPQTPQQIAVATYAGLLGQGYPPELAKQMAITFARRVPETAPPGAPRQLGTGARFVTTAAGETVPATAAGPQIPDYARPLAMPANDYQAPAVDPSSVRAVPGTYAERVDAARTAPETMGGANAPAARLSRFATWKDDDLQFAADNGIPAVQAGAQAEIARRAALPPAEAAAATPAPTAAPSSSAPITDFSKFTQDALRYAADRGTPEYKAAAQAEIARRKGAAADRATARQQTRAEADAAEQADLAELVAQAQANGYAGDPAALQAQLATRLQDIKDLHAAVDESGTNGITLLRAIAKNGGLSVTAAEAAGQGGELRWLKEFQDTKPSASRTNLQAPPVAVSGQVRGVGGVFRTATEQTRGGRAGGQDLGAMLEKLHADGRFSHITDTNALSDAIREAATGRADSRNAIADLAAASRDLLYPAVDESFDPATLEATAAERANVRRGGFGAGPPRPPVDPAPPPPDRPNTTRGGFGAGQPPAAPVPDVPDTPTPPASSASSAPAIKVIETPRPNGTAYLQVKNDAGAVGGEVTNGQLRINAAEVSPRGQGLGQELYKRLIDQATQRGLTVVSDNTVEAAAVNVYTALARKGYTVTKNPRAFELTLEDGSKALGAPRGESVFTIAPPAEGVSSAPPTIRAYHGSPHDFAQFDASKIGTGEGAAAYGHGLYFAENPAVAEGYRTTLATPTAETPAFRLRGEPVAIGTDHWQIAQLLETPKAGETPAAMVTRRIGELEDQAKFAARAYGEDAASMYHLQANRLRAIDPADLTFHRPGKTYEVNIHTDPEHLLDWDLPLSQQPESIRYVLGYQPPPTPAAVDAVIADAKRRGVAPASLPEYQALQAQADAAAKMDRDYPNGAAIYNEWMHDARNLAIRQGRDPETTLPASQAAASEEFRKMGITGIRYLDQGSRNAGGWHITPPEQTTSKKWMVKSSDYNSKGLHFDTKAEAEAALAEKVKGQTRNYVVFDAKLIDILKKYGVLLPAAGLGVAAAGQVFRGQDEPAKK